MTTEVFKEMKDFSVSELEEVISLAKEELNKRYAAHRAKLRENFMAAYSALTDEGIDIRYADPCTGQDIFLSRGDCFYFI